MSAPTSSDRELLELAARAAGYKFDSTHPFEIAVEHKAGTNWYEWNPLTDDGDTHRLAVKLRLDVEFHGEFGVSAMNYELCGSKNLQGAGETATMGYDIEAATRRAVTRAAAQIGKAQP
jgi:hypothetical protein